MKIKETKKSLISSILFLIFGALIFAYPNQVVTTASIIFGAILLFYGIVMVIKNYYETKNDSNTTSTTLMFGILLIIIGLLFIILSNVVSQIIQYVLGAWILFTGIERLMIALSLGKDNNSFITQIIIASLLLIAGLYTILRGHLEIQIIGIVMIVYAILEIIGYFSNKDTMEHKEEVVIEKKIETKEEVKEAKVVEEKPKKKSKK